MNLLALVRTKPWSLDVSVSAALLCLLLWLIAALLGQFYGTEANLIHLDRILLGPDLSQWLGSDDLGRSLSARILVGARVSLGVSVTVVSLSLTVGVLIGLLSAYVGGMLDTLLLIVMDIVLAFPGLLLAIALAGLMGPGIDNVVIALCLVSWVGFARFTRAQALSLQTRDHVVAARAIGVAEWLTLFRHVLPFCLTPIIVEASYGVASVIVAEAGLSFLGLGVQAPDASWGNIIHDGARYLLVAPHVVVIPGLLLLLVVLALNRIGDWLQDLTQYKS